MKGRIGNDKRACVGQRLAPSGWSAIRNNHLVAKSANRRNELLAVQQRSPTCVGVAGSGAQFLLWNKRYHFVRGPALSLFRCHKYGLNVEAIPGGQILADAPHLTDNRIPGRKLSPMSSSGVQMTGQSNPRSRQIRASARAFVAFAMCTQSRLPGNPFHAPPQLRCAQHPQRPCEQFSTVPQIASGRRNLKPRAR
jgi:hypothetical protein